MVGSKNRRFFIAFLLALGLPTARRVPSWLIGRIFLVDPPLKSSKADLYNQHSHRASAKKWIFMHKTTAFACERL